MIAIVTGANSGMGKATVAALADKGYETITGMLKPFFLTPTEAAKRLYDLSARLVRLENYVD